MTDSAARLERQVLGCVLADDRAIDLVVGRIDEGDFGAPVNRLVWRTVLEIHAAGRPVDPITVAVALWDNPLFGGGRGLRDLTWCANQTASAYAIVEYASLLREASVKRQIASALATTHAPNGKPAAEELAALHELADGLSGRLARTESPTQTACDAIREMLAELPRIWAGEKPPAYCRTGFVGVDRVLGGGLYCGYITALAARPGVGKSALAEQIARHVAERGEPVTYYSEEMDAAHHLARMARRSGTRAPMSAIFGRGLSEWDQADLCTRLTEMAPLPLAFLRRPRRPVVDEVIAALDADFDARRPRLIVIDHLQLLEPRTKRARADLEFGEITGELRRWAKTRGPAVLLLHQLNRAIDRDNRSGEPRRPVLSDLRECGKTEEDSAAVAFLHRPHMPREPIRGEPPPEPCEVVVPKSRNAGVGVVPMVWSGQRIRFEDAPDALDEELPL